MSTKKLRKLNSVKYLIIIFIILIVLLFYWLLSRSFLYLTVYPTNATVTVDNASVILNSQGKGQKIVKPGSHTIRIDADGYISKLASYKFLGGLTKKISFSLAESPTPIKIASDGTFLSKGKDNNQIIYLGDQGKTLYQTTFSSGVNNTLNFKSLPITDSKLSGIKDMILSPNRDLALFKKADDAYLFDFQKYDFVHQTETLWGKNIGDIAWAPDNSKIAYYNQSDGTLIFSNVANTEQDRILNLNDYNISNPYLKWSPDSQYLLVIPRNSDYSQNKIYVLKTSSKALSLIADIGSQIGASFSSDSQKILYSTYSANGNNQNNSAISIMDKNGDNKKSLNLRANLNNIIWMQNNNLVAAIYDQLSQKNGIYSFDINGKSLNGSILKTSEVIDSLINVSSNSSNDSTIAYQSENAIYAFKIQN